MFFTQILSSCNNFFCNFSNSVNERGNLSNKKFATYGYTLFTKSNSLIPESNYTLSLIACTMQCSIAVRFLGHVSIKNSAMDFIFQIGTLLLKYLIRSLLGL